MHTNIKTKWEEIRSPLVPVEHPVSSDHAYKHFWYCQLTSFLFVPHEKQGKNDEFPRHGVYHGFSNLEKREKIFDMTNSFQTLFPSNKIKMQKCWWVVFEKSTETKHVYCLIKSFHFKKFSGIRKSRAHFLGVKK